MTITYSIAPHVGAESGAAAAEGCYTYSLTLSILPPSGEPPRSYGIGSFENGDALAAAVERARTDPAYVIDLLARSIDLRQHHLEASRRDHEAARKRLEARLQVAEPTASDLGGRVAAASHALLEAGWALQRGESAKAWVDVLRAVAALDHPGGLDQMAAALRAAEHLERWLNASFPIYDAHAVGVVSAAWDAAAGAWYVECRAEGMHSLWGVCVVAGSEPEVVEET